MKHIAQWIQSIQNRARAGASLPNPTTSPSSPTARPKVSSAITPENVPKFVIPSRQRKMGCCRTQSDSERLTNTVHSSSSPSHDENQRCKKHIRDVHKSTYRKVASLPSQMCELVEDGDTASELEFPHLKTKTSSYGYKFVGEAPHTHRKESLFMGGNSLEMLHQFQKRHHSCSVDSPLCQNNTQLPTEQTTAPVAIPRRQRNRGAPSRSLPNRNNSIDEAQCQCSFVDHRSDTDSRLSDASDLSSSPGGLQMRPSAGENMIKVSLFYHKHRQQLEVRALQGQNLMSRTEDVECNAYVKVYLEPGKGLKQQTNIVRGSRNPVFDTTITFSNVSKSDLMTKNLRLKVCNKLGSGVPLYNKRSVIGETTLALKELQLQKSQEHISWQQLEDASDTQCVARLSTTVELNKEEGQLYVTIGEISNLRPSNPPDCYVTIDVTQNGRSLVKKQTQVKRNNSSPIFNDIFAFSISTSEDKLPSTCVAIKVMSKSRLRQDTTFGELSLTGSTPSERLTFWSNLLNVANNKRSQWSEISSLSKS